MRMMVVACNEDDGGGLGMRMMVVACNEDDGGGLQ